jgi:hypothetical protein
MMALREKDISKGGISQENNNPEDFQLLTLPQIVEFLNSNGLVMEDESPFLTLDSEALIDTLYYVLHT